MQPCSRCQGEGSVIEDDDGYISDDMCYHCSGSGRVDEETAFSDELMAVADTLAYWTELDYKKFCSEEPYGDNYNLIAAENQMSEYDYFRSRVWDRAYSYAEKLMELPVESQELMVAWHNEIINAPRKVSLSVREKLSINQNNIDPLLHDQPDDDDIPF